MMICKPKNCIYSSIYVYLDLNLPYTTIFIFPISPVTLEFPTYRAFQNFQKVLMVPIQQVEMLECTRRTGSYSGVQNKSGVMYTVIYRLHVLNVYKESLTENLL